MSSGGRVAACLSSSGAEGWCVERINLHSGASATPLAGEEPLHLGVQLVALDDGRVAVCDPTGGMARFWIAGEPAESLGRVQAEGSRILGPPPGRSGPLHAITYHREGRSTIWRLHRGQTPEPLATVPSAVAGGTWLDAEGRMLALDQIGESGGSDAVSVDLVTGERRTVISISNRSSDRIVGFHPSSGLLLASTDAGGRDRLGWGVPGKVPVHFPDSLHRSEAATQLLDVDPRTGRFIVSEETGATSRIVAVSPRDGARASISLPAGTLAGPARVSGSRLHAAWSAPAVPATVASVSLDARGAIRYVHRPRSWATAAVCRVPGAEAPVEAIVYGDPVRAPRVVIALHGGPLAAWRLGFDALFQSLAAAGVAIVAPNQRGSIGYGAAWTNAIRGAWGGPDLADIRALVRELWRVRHGQAEPRPVLFGASYGAFLALLTAAAEPRAVSGTAAIAPFVSARSLRAVASPIIRQLLDRQSACEVVSDDLGDRDLERLAPRIAAPVLILHGTADDVIPVQQTRTLERALRLAGRRASVHVLPGEGHDPAKGAARERVHSLLTAFCLRAA
jgi:pimeloyl-ACP methyl ester carboxylesterase